jgi:two-component system sensor histidine kinase/response regulator
VCLRGKADQLLTNYQVFDHSALNELYELQSEDDPHLVSELIKDYLSQLDTNINGIVVAFSQSDFKNVEAGAHSLKSSSRVLGLERMGEICFELEEAGRTCHLKTESLTSLLETSVASAQALQAYLTKAA